MEEYDFLFVYEVKNRELENICLLKIELEKRGYSVFLIETWYAELYSIKKVNAKVVVAFALYNNPQIEFVCNFAYKPQKIVNLQWEQVFTIADEENENTLYNIKESAKNAVHISWGEFNYNRLVCVNGVDKNNAYICGHIALDFYKPLLEGYYLERSELCRLYGLDESRKIHLFISTFSWCEVPDFDLQQEVYQNLAFDPFEFRHISRESQSAILDWYEKAAMEFPNIQFIYRSHPAEIGNERLAKLQERYENFYVINEKSIKQWVLIADEITTWYSTSIVEVFCANKTCAVLRPVKIPREMDIRIYLECEAINSYDRLRSFILGNEKEAFPISKDIINKYYQFDEQYSFIKVIEVLEKVLNTETYSFDYYNKTVLGNDRNIRKLIKKCIPDRILFWRKKIIKILDRTKLRIAKKGFLPRDFSNVEHLFFSEKMIQRNYASDDEIRIICDKMSMILKKNYEKRQHIE